MIELRAGIHPDLSGRENVYLNGELLGMTRRDVNARFDSIVDFAEIPEAIDRQVKYYSSGMQMRLGFAVAAFLEPDIMLVDEVLAVGDAGFQQRCLERMRSLLESGTSLVFVSHDLASVEATCRRGVWLDGGVLRADGPIRDVLASYRGLIEQSAELAAEGTGPIRVLRADVSDPDGGPVRSQGRMEISLELKSLERVSGRLCLGVSEGTATPIFTAMQPIELGDGDRSVSCSVPFVPLPSGVFFLWLAIVKRGGDALPWRPVARFEIIGRELRRLPEGIMRLAPIQIEPTWDLDHEA
jgi:ABC-2 type transport system ATP-binding protein